MTYLFKAFLLGMLLGILLTLCVANASAAGPTVDPMKEIRCCEDPIRRNADGTIYRDPKVLAEFRRQNPCPSTGLTTGACPGWQINHGYPRDCGGFDAVWNLLWMSNLVKTSAVIGQDRYERKVHGTGNCTAVPPGGIVYPAKHGTLVY